MDVAPYYTALLDDVDTSTLEYRATINNSLIEFLPYKVVKIEKHIVGGNDKTVFDFVLNFGMSEDEMIRFIDSYSLYESDSDGDDTNDIYLGERDISEDGYIKLLAGEYVVIELPAGVEYQVEEKLPLVDDLYEYSIIYEKDKLEDGEGPDGEGPDGEGPDGEGPDGDNPEIEVQAELSHMVITNIANTYVSINNTTNSALESESEAFAKMLVEILAIFWMIHRLMKQMQLLNIQMEFYPYSGLLQIIGHYQMDLR